MGRIQQGTVQGWSTITRNHCRNNRNRISEMQHTFMKDRGTRNAIFNICMLSKRSIGHQQDIFSLTTKRLSIRSDMENSLIYYKQSKLTTNHYKRSLYSPQRLCSWESSCVSPQRTNQVGRDQTRSLSRMYCIPNLVQSVWEVSFATTWRSPH